MRPASCFLQNYCLKASQTTLMTPHIFAFKINYSRFCFLVFSFGARIQLVQPKEGNNRHQAWRAIRMCKDMLMGLTNTTTWDQVRTS